MPVKRSHPAIQRRLPQQAMRKLRDLETQLNEVNAAYLDRLHREVEGLLITVKTRGGRERISRDETRDLDTIMGWLDELDVKPEKGRRKDLRKIDRIIGKIQSVLDGWS
ncbi:MAG: hypothetical protein AAGK14_03225 [Verrucomicrobiota bacterium]